MHKLTKGDPRRGGREIVVQAGSDLEKRLLAQGFTVAGIVNNTLSPRRRASGLYQAQRGAVAS